MTKPFVETDETCGTCGRKLVIDRNNHYVCLKCERKHSCLQTTNQFGRRNKGEIRSSA